MRQPKRVDRGQMRSSLLCDFQSSIGRGISISKFLSQEVDLKLT